MIAMLKQFAPRVVIPPSPNNRAWIASASEIAKAEAHGPKTMAATVTPSACPVVPPGSGILNIITTNENAANTDIRGMVRVAKARFVFRRAEYHPAAEKAYSVAQVEGLK